MSELDRLLAQAEAQQNSDEWEVLNKYRREVTYVDDDGYVNIVGRKIDTIRENVSVQGEQYSQYIEFLMDRFYDGVDLAEQTLAIHYEVEGNGGEDAPINVYKNSTQLKFGWLIGPNVAQYAQPVEFCIWVRGTLINGNKYVLKTLPQIYTPKRGLVLGGGIPKPDNNWYLQFSLSMDEKVNQSALNANQAASSANEAKTAEIVVLQAQQEVSQKSEVVDTQYKEIKIMHQEAEQYRDEALQFRNEAEQFTPDGYDSLVEQVNKNTVAVSTIVEKADLGIKETASGEEIYLFDSSNGKPPEFSMYGKVTQNTTSGKNLLENKANTQTVDGVTFTINNDKSISLLGSATNDINFIINDSLKIPVGNYKSSVLNGNASIFMYVHRQNADDSWNYGITNSYSNPDLSLTDDYKKLIVGITIKNGTNVDNTVIKPMIRLASITDDTWEPYTGGKSSPNPDYPQDIEVAGESYNLLENAEENSEKEGVKFVVNDDKSITANGTSSGWADFLIHPCTLEAGTYRLTGCPSNGGNGKYVLYIPSTYLGREYVDNGNGVEFTLTETKTFGVSIVVYSGTTVPNLTFYPMIRKASVKNDRYMPYGKGSVEVKSVGKNLLKNDAVTYATNGITFTVKDGIITANGTATENATLIIHRIIEKGQVVDDSFFDKTVFLNGCPLGGSPSTYKLQLFNYESGKISSDFGSGSEVVTIRNTGQEYCSIAVIVYKGATVNDAVFKPMIRLASDTDDTYEPYKETLSTISTENGLAGIPVDSKGNYTDSNGQQWICDEIVKYADGSGEKIQRIGKTVLNGSEGITWNVNDDGIRVVVYCKPNALWDKHDVSKKYDTNILCNCLIGDLISSGTNRVYFDNNWLNMSFDSGYFTSSDEFNAWLTNNNLEFWYELATPIITPLTAEEIAEIEKLSTFYPATNISNDFDCGMGITYVVDAKNYIDNKLAQIAAAMINNV